MCGGDYVVYTVLFVKTIMPAGRNHLPLICSNNIESLKVLQLSFPCLPFFNLNYFKIGLTAFDFEITRTHSGNNTKLKNFSLMRQYNGNDATPKMRKQLFELKCS